MPKQVQTDFTEEWTEPKGFEAVKKGNKEFYRYCSNGGRRLLNVNRWCIGCSQERTCYKGKHSLVGCCTEKN